MLHCSFSLAAAQLLVKVTSALRKANVAVQLPQRNFPKIAAQLPPPLGCDRANLRGGGVWCDTLRYLKNISAIGIAIPYSAIGGLRRLGSQLSAGHWRVPKISKSEGYQKQSFLGATKGP